MDPMQAQLEAFNNRDLEAFLACYAPDIVIEGPDGAPMMRGHDEMRVFYGQLFAHSPRTSTARSPSRIRVASFAIDEERTTGVVMEGFPDRGACGGGVPPGKGLHRAHAHPDVA